ncbi:TRM11 family SAM-dependent methyltransferase [Propionibacterium australiense]|uniref:S-adenosyl-L-methionine-dependent methyltransferase n=1 Tax=Propionibacterium australiense TaxID=119981 RepID=A0A383S6Q3_9ACTN|nr:site-specific DNA-methyltransferase [Propionibacterium australiense]RLP09747.1 site-specific DNA-methyltransferase [Propionibacterium australiense]RLP10198.1 site-specific DNA-methyltransferase [Propionibacterium australiense]SYZ33222.1 S-adenosyl-L-methionine-dependent methyltransferase [Propionibacterium australiense]VEH89294.1 Uncharacterised protein [Propionibacterium australiense]
MSDYVMLVAPSANRVYAGQAPSMAAAELAVTTTVESPARTTVAGVEYVGFGTDALDAAAIARQSSALALFELTGGLLRPVPLPNVQVMDDDLVTITKYAGKTNEMFTRLLLHVTCSQVRTATPGRPALPGGGRQLDVLDPMAGRGTTLQAAWQLGHNGFGVETDEKAIEQLAAFMKTYLRRKRLRHKADSAHVRREGRVIGQRFDVTASPGVTTNGHEGLEGAPELAMSVLTGDTRDSARLFGRRRFDAIVTDAPYGIVHAARSSKGGRSARGRGGARGDRSPATLLAQAVPVWAGQLRAGGALGIAWNALGITRDELAGICTDAGLVVCAGPGWGQFSHRVDSSIRRDLLVARRPAG